MNSTDRLKEALPVWLAQRVKRGQIRASTATGYGKRLRKWVYPTLGATPVSAITREQIGTILLTVQEAGRSAGIIKQIVNPLKLFYQEGIELGLFQGPNPAGDLKFFTRRKKGNGNNGTGVDKFFTPEEEGKLLAVAKRDHPRWYPFILTGLKAGLRWGESAALQWSDVDLKQGILHVTKTVSGDQEIAPVKDGEGRRIRMSPGLLEALEEHKRKAKAEASGLVFPSKQGKLERYNHFLTAIWRTILEVAKLPYRGYHATRHTFATRLLDGGADPRRVQKAMGHSSLNQTEGYAHDLGALREGELGVLDGPGPGDRVTHQEEGVSPILTVDPNAWLKRFGKNFSDLSLDGSRR